MGGLGESARIVSGKQRSVSGFLDRPLGGTMGGE